MWAPVGTGWGTRRHRHYGIHPRPRVRASLVGARWGPGRATRRHHRYGIHRRPRVGASLVGARGDGVGHTPSSSLRHSPTTTTRTGATCRGVSCGRPWGRAGYVMPDSIRYPRWGPGRAGTPFGYNPAPRTCVPPLPPSTGAHKRRPYMVPAGPGPGSPIHQPPPTDRRTPPFHRHAVVTTSSRTSQPLHGRPQETPLHSPSRGWAGVRARHTPPTFPPSPPAPIGDRLTPLNRPHFIGVQIQGNT